MRIPDDQIKALRARDPAALQDLVNRYTEPLLAAGLGWGLSRDQAEELAQDTFVAFLAGLDRFEGRSQLKTYLFGILYNKASELRRRQAREESTEDIETVFDSRFDAAGHWIGMPGGPEKELLNKELQEIIRQCSEKLSFAQRTAFYLKEVEGQSTESLCNILGVSVTHLGVLLFRARNKMRDCVEGKWGKS